MIRKSLIIFFVLLFVFFALKTNAQVQSGDIILSINPQYPRANEQVKASISTTSANLNKSKITWSLNGEVGLSGVGKKDYNFTSGDYGINSTIEVVIETTDGSVINKQITVSPGEINLLWEASDTYVPPFYKGKTLNTKEGRVKVVAMLNSSSLGGLSYAWNQDGDNMQNSSGYGKNSYAYKNSYLEKLNNVNVEVSDLLGNTIGQGSITIRPNNPKILFYKKDPTFGTIWTRTINDGYTINQSGETIVAEPYFFSPKNLNSSALSFKWLLGGSQIATPDPINELSIKPEEGKSGQSKISLDVENINTLFLSLKKELNVNF